MLDESNTSQSAYGNVTSMIDSTSRQTNDTNFSLKKSDITSLARRLAKDKHPKSTSVSKERPGETLPLV